jgi:thiol-disulfide isomerase/thioredoxin
MNDRNMKNLKFALFLIILQASVFVQGQGFTLKAYIPGMPDGLSVALLGDEGEKSVTLDSAVVRNCRFELKGKVGHPMICTLITNNLDLLPKDGDNKNIRWTYTPVFVSNTGMTFEAVHYDSVSNDKPIGTSFRIIGGTPQKDFNEYNTLLQQKQGEAPYLDVNILHQLQVDFIKAHPHSVLSVQLANAMLFQADPRLSKKEIVQLNKMITTVPDDEARLAEFRKNSMEAQRTAVNEKLLNLSLLDANDKSHNLTDIVPKGKYVLVDFWASWCGICRAQIPDIKKLAAKYAHRLVVVSISNDRSKKDWLAAVDKEKMSWKQYRLTKQGSQDLRTKYLVQGEPYYLMVNPKGLVVAAPSSVEEMEEILLQ